jgi:hypothetical protein
MDNLQEKDMNAALPCPFCGAEPRLVDLAGWEVHCDCGVGMVVDSPEREDVLKAWNRRVGERWARELLSDCASTFRHYERLHLGKMPPDTEKATSNANKAAHIEWALTHNALGQEPCAAVCARSPAPTSYATDGTGD